MKQGKKWVAVGLCAALCLGSCGVAMALPTTPQNRSLRPAGQAASQTQAPAQTGAQKAKKDEMVYIMAHAGGDIDHIVVSDWLQNPDSLPSLQDESHLINIENTKGDETFSASSGDQLVWKAGGHDIYYQGQVEDPEALPVPVTLTVTYTLNGQPINAQELAGRSGHVTMRFTYQNNQTVSLTEENDEKKTTVPFVALTGLVLSNDTFTHVTVDGGRLMNDGDRTAVVGLSFPGLQQALGLQDSTLSLPDGLTITADVTNFSMGETMTLITSEPFAHLQDQELSSMDDLSGSLNELNTAMQQLLDGSTALAGGLSTLRQKAEALPDAVAALQDGALALQEGAGDLKDGAGKLKDGAATLSGGLQTLAGQNDALTGGARQVFESLLQQASGQLAQAGLSAGTLSIDNYAQTLSDLIASLDENAVYEKVLAAVTQAVNDQRPAIRDQVEEAVRQQVQTAVTATVQQTVTEQVTETVRHKVLEQVVPAVTSGKLDAAGYEAALAAGTLEKEVQTAVEQAVEQQMNSEDTRATITSTTETQMQSDSVQKTIQDETDAQMKTDSMQATVEQNTDRQVEKAISEQMASDKVQQQLSAASKGAQAVIQLKASLDAYNSFYLGLLAYTDGVSDASDGAAALLDGAEQLAAGAGDLSDGAGQLYDGLHTLSGQVPSLLDGIAALDDGAEQLKDGLTKFDEQGVQKLVDAAGGFDELAGSLRDLTQAAGQYRTYTGLSSSMDGQVTFLYRTEAITS